MGLASRHISDLLTSYEPKYRLKTKGDLTSQGPSTVAQPAEGELAN